MRLGFIFSVHFIGLLICTTAAQAAGETYRLSVGAHVISAKLAMTQATRAHGLMRRHQLCANCGMLFIFPQEKKWSFWSKNTPLALSVAFIGKTGNIIGLTDMEPGSLDIHTSPGKAACALEMQLGWFSSNGIKIGDRFSDDSNGKSKFKKLIHARCGLPVNCRSCNRASL